MLLLTQQDCALCDQAKKLLSRLGAQYPLDIEVVDFSSARGFELANSGGILFPPGIFLDGQPLSYGRPSEGKLRREIEARLSRAATAPEEPRSQGSGSESG